MENVSFHLKRGEIFGIGGLVGAWCSEVLSAIFGYLTHGVTKQVFVGGKPAKITCPQDAIRLGMGCHRGVQAVRLYLDAQHPLQFNAGNF